jgi:hypothetical protein
MNECPVCGEVDKWHYSSGWVMGEPIEPPEGWCDFCGFSFMGDCKQEQVEKYTKAIIQKIEDVHGDIEVVADHLKALTEFQLKIPKLKKRLEQN